MLVDGCEVCAVIPGNESIFETDSWIVTLSRDQGYLGRCYVTLRQHKSSVSEITDQEWIDFAGVTRRLESATREALGATLHNWGCLMNNAFQAENAKPHVHWHMRPRYDKPVTMNGIEFTDPEFGHHYDRNQKCLVDKKTYDTIKNAIQDRSAPDDPA